MTFPNQLALISPADLQKLVEDSIRKVLAEKDDAGPVGALGVVGAAKFLGVGKRKFYYLLDENPALAEACFYIGTRRLWRTAILEDWAKRQEGRSQPKKEAA